MISNDWIWFYWYHFDKNLHSSFTLFPNSFEEHLENCLKIFTYCLKLIWKLMVHIWWYCTLTFFVKIFKGKIFWKIEYVRKKWLKHNFFLHLTANQVLYGSSVKLHCQMIFSCLMNNSITVEILKSTPLLSSFKYKNDSLCLYTL